MLGLMNISWTGMVVIGYLMKLVTWLNSFQGITTDTSQWISGPLNKTSDCCNTFVDHPEIGVTRYDNG
ncbi:hypothetical protein Peur_047865 [Populus x canadensis]